MHIKNIFKITQIFLGMFLGTLACASCFACSDANKNSQESSLQDPSAQDASLQTQFSYSQISTTGVKNTIDNLKPDNQMQQINCDISTSSEYKNMLEEVSFLESLGKSISFIMIDIKSSKGVAYNIDKPGPSQSTIKAPYVASLLEYDPNIWNEWKDNITDIITLSSNEKYEKIRQAFGDEIFVKFCESVGVDKKNAQALYPKEITVRDMAKIWTKMYTLLNNSESGTWKQFAKLFEHTVCSSTQDVIGRKYKTHCKSGWEDGLELADDGTMPASPSPRMTDGNPANDEITTNDTGIVYSGENPYLFITFTDLPALPYYMHDFASAIDDVHDKLVG